MRTEEENDRGVGSLPRWDVWVVVCGELETFCGYVQADDEGVAQKLARLAYGQAAVAVEAATYEKWI